MSTHMCARPLTHSPHHPTYSRPVTCCPPVHSSPPTRSRTRTPARSRPRVVGATTQRARSACALCRRPGPLAPPCAIVHTGWCSGSIVRASHGPIHYQLIQSLVPSAELKFRDILVQYCLMNMELKEKEKRNQRQSQIELLMHMRRILSTVGDRYVYLIVP